MDLNIFSNKSSPPDKKELINALGKCNVLWFEIIDYVTSKYPAAMSEWYFPGEKYGWNFRIKDKKRAIVYLLPREYYFMAAFVFGPKAFEKVMTSNISDRIKKELASAKVYAEGRGIRIQVTARNLLPDIKKLVDIKLSS